MCFKDGVSPVKSWQISQLQGFKVAVPRHHCAAVGCDSSDGGGPGESGIDADRGAVAELPAGRSGRWKWGCMFVPPVGQFYIQ